MNHKSLRIVLKLLHGCSCSFRINFHTNDNLLSQCPCIYGIVYKHKFCFHEKKNPPNDSDNCHSGFDLNAKRKKGEQMVHFKLFKRFVLISCFGVLLPCRTKKNGKDISWFCNWIKLMIRIDIKNSPVNFRWITFKPNCSY